VHFLCGQKNSVTTIFIKKYFLFTVGRVLFLNAVDNWVKKLSQGRSKLTDVARPGHPVEIATEATVQWMKELI
jgi:hypothetical protein